MTPAETSAEKKAAKYAKKPHQLFPRQKRRAAEKARKNAGHRRNARHG
jgi:hypothetical protein